MNATQDDIRKALTVLGYKTPYFARTIIPDPVQPLITDAGWYEIGVGGPIRLDLASLLRRCREREKPIFYRIEGPLLGKQSGKVWAYVCSENPRVRGQAHADDDPTTALILALAAMGQKENGNGNK